MPGVQLLGQAVPQSKTVLVFFSASYCATIDCFVVVVVVVVVVVFFCFFLLKSLRWRVL